MMNTINAYSNNCSYNVHLRHVFILITAIIISGILIHGVSATPINGPAVISSPGTYQLQNDVINDPFNLTWIGIFIQGTNVELDGMGHTIDCRGTGTQGPALRGIYIHKSDNAAITEFVVKNVTVKKCYSGINATKAKNGRIENSILAENHCGIELIGLNYVGGFSQGNNLTLNTIRDNTVGIHLTIWADLNNIYNNYFNNTQNVDFDATPANTNYWNITKTAGTSIVGGPYLGGNYWATPSGNGFSQTCPDTNNDGICDSQYDLTSDNLRNIDYLPLTKQKQTVEITIKGSINAWPLNIGTNENTNSIDMNVKSTGDWSVKVKDNREGGKPPGTEGKMAEYDGTRYVSGGKMLSSPIYVKSGTGAYKELSGTETIIQEGTKTSGTEYDIGIRQTVSLSDAVLTRSNKYRVVITFIGSLT